MIRAQEQSGEIPNLISRMPAGVGGGFNHHLIGTRANIRASVSYVTGAHNMKFGYQGGFSNPTQNYYVLQRSDQCPAQRRRAEPADGRPSVDEPAASSYVRNLLPTSFYVQDQWTTRRLTLQGGLRYDHLLTTYPDSELGGPGYTADAERNLLSRRGRPRASTGTTSRRAWASPTTCSGMARRP